MSKIELRHSRKIKMRFFIFVTISFGTFQTETPKFLFERDHIGHTIVFTKCFTKGYNSVGDTIDDTIGYSIGFT